MSAPFGWIFKGGVSDPKLHRMMDSGDPNWPEKPKCGTKMDRSCLEPVYEREAARWAARDLCGRCFSKKERQERQAEEDRIDRERVERMEAAYEAQQAGEQS